MEFKEVYSAHEIKSQRVRQMVELSGVSQSPGPHCWPPASTVTGNGSESTMCCQSLPCDSTLNSVSHLSYFTLMTMPWNGIYYPFSRDKNAESQRG